MEKESKVCSKCKRVLPLSYFHKNGFDSKGQQKYRGYCKDCANTLEKERYRKKKAFIDSQKECCAKCGDTRVYVLDFGVKAAPGTNLPWILGNSCMLRWG